MPDAKQGEVCSSIVCFIFWSLFVPEANWHELRDQLDEGHVGAACLAAADLLAQLGAGAGHLTPLLLSIFFAKSCTKFPRTNIIFIFTRTTCPDDNMSRGLHVPKTTCPEEDLSRSRFFALQTMVT